MDELDLLLLSPYRDITERAKAAIENAKNAGDRAPPLMLKSAEKLLKESERALKEIEPLSTNHYEQYGSVFVDTTKNHDEIARWRYELEELLWDFDDYIKVEDFNAAKFDALEKLSKRAALKTIDILKRLRVGEVLNNTPSVDKSVENPHEGHYKLSGSAAQGERIPTQLFSRLQRSGRPEFPGGCTASRPQSTPPSTLTPTYPRASKASSPSYQNYMYPEPPENSESSTKNLSSDAINRSDLSNTRFSEGLIPVALSDFEATSYVPLQEPDCTITASSSFRMLNGFCEGAKEAQRGQLGFKRLKRQAGVFPTALVAKCTSCVFELDWKLVEEDLDNNSSGNFKSNTVRFRLRFLQKAHLSSRHTDEQMYGCPFCVQQGHTTEESDATVFFSQKQLFEHLARHPRPLPLVAGFTVVEGRELSPHLKNNFDLRFLHPPFPSAIAGFKSEILRLPMAVAIVTTKTSYGTIRSPLDRQRLLRLSVGAKILGIKFPSEYEGKWAVGWHDNIHAAFETEAVRINVPPENQLKALPRSSSVSAVARWEWDQKDNDGPWLKFRKGDIIQNISWIHADDWYWCGTTSGGWGIFPQSHLDSESITTNALKGRNLRPFSTGSTSTRKEVSSDLESTKLTINEALIRAHYKRSISDEILSTERDIVQKLKGIGLSGQAIGEALHLDETIGGNNDSLFYTNYSAWLVYLADRLGDRYSKTRETAIIEGAIQLAITSMKETMSIGSHEIEWLSDLGTKLEALDATTNNSTTVKTAIFEWEIPSVFCSQDLNDGGDNVDLRAEIRDFVVLSGSDGAFEATTCAQYLDDKFGAAGLEVLETVVDVLASVNISNSSSNIESSPKKTASRLKKSAIALQVEIVSRSCITLTTHEPNFNPAHIACMRWLCEALRAVQAYSSGEPEPGHWLMKSRGSSCLQLGTIKKGTPSIIAFTLEPLQQLSIREIGVDRCWVKLFKSAVIAWAPLKHCWGTGLRLSYEMLVRLSAVTNYVFIDSSASGSPPGEADPTGETTRETTGGLVALGFFTALIPVAYDPATNTTQWHLEVTDNSIMQPENLKILNGKWLQVKSPESFFESHCILGWKGDVSVTLGTREGCYDLEWTDLPRVERVFRLEGFEIGAEIGTGDVLPISLKHSGTFSFKACSTVQSFTASAHYEQAIRLLSHHVALVYDSESQIAWLVPQLSWNLHLCHIWYRHVHYGRDSYDPIPFARLSTEGSSAACEALHMQSELVVLEGLTLNQLFLQIYRNMTSSNRYRQKPRKSLIFGTETMDLIEEPGMGSLLRRLQLPEADQSWQYLAAKADSIGFCKGLGQALTPQNQNSDHTCGCDTIPSNRSLLVAHNTCIERLLRRESITLNALQNSIVDLDYGKEWFMENWPFDTCSHNPENDYWTAANVFMQRIAKPTRWGMKKKAINWKGHCSPIPTTGAFVFGNPPYKESQSWNPNKWLPVSQKSMIS